MKKLIVLFICFIMMLSVSGAYAYEEELVVATVTVNLAQGAVMLNGELLVTQQAPYVNENGDTMIELSVLVNALGAELNEFEDVYLVTVGETSMVYRLNSAVVEIGGQSIAMNSPVVLSENSVVMVPLRFVSEALGADVTYDGELGEIKIVSSGGIDETANYNLLFKYSGKDKIGNSEEYWRFTKTDNFDMTETYYDGDYEFLMDDIMMSFVVCDKSDGVSLEKLYIQMQEVSQYDRKVMFDKGKGNHNGTPYVFTKLRTLNVINERYAYETEKYFYLVDIERGFENFASAKEDAIVNTFLESLEFDYKGGEEDITVDLAKAETPENFSDEKKTEYIDGNYRWSVKLDDTWEVDEYYGFYNQVSIYRQSGIESDEKENEDVYYYYDEYEGSPSITISTYSAEDNQTVEQWANKKRSFYADYFNSEVYVVSDVKNVKIGNNQAQYFEVHYSTDKSYVKKMYYINGGSYRYEIDFSYDVREEEKDDFLKSAEYVICSFTPGQIDINEVGKTLESDNEMEFIKVLAEYKGDMFTITYPCMWQVEESETGFSLSSNGYGNSYGYDMLSLLSPQLSLLYGVSDDASLLIEKRSLSYYDDEMNQKTYTLEEYMKKNLAATLNASNALLNVSMSGEIKETMIMGLKGYCVELDITAQSEETYYTIYYLPYQQDSIITVTKNCGKVYKNTIFEKALDDVIKSLTLS